MQMQTMSSEEVIKWVVGNRNRFLVWRVFVSFKYQVVDIILLL
ncbi:hypothetical protein Hdeb2414_s0006g00190131 [Helianthus debilis subsp. tardiflorus]